MIKPSQTVAGRFRTVDDTGALTDADSLPTGAMARNTAADGTVTVTVANVSTGLYSFSATVPAGYSAGDCVQIDISATIGGIATGGTVFDERVDTIRPSDALPNAAAGATGGVMINTTLTEPAAVPAWATSTTMQWLAWIGALARNKVTETATTQTLRNDADSANIATSTVSDDGSQFTRGEWS